jgi:hypothetical protein
MALVPERLARSLALALAVLAGALPAHAGEYAPVDTLSFAPEPDEEGEQDIPYYYRSDQWRRPSSGDPLITDRDEWRSRQDHWQRYEMRVDYNRVDRLRLGMQGQFQSERMMLPRLGARLEYPFDREVWLYGVQLEQPVVPPGRLALGFSMERRTDHHELQQVKNVENSLALLFGRNDYRDYFEREGFGVYLSWRVPDFSTVSAHLRNDDYTTLALIPGTRSWFHRDRPLRDNPAIDEGESHTWSLRLERLAHDTDLTRAGMYHWIDLERSGHELSGDFDYTRLIADLRSVIRLSPSQTLALRGVMGWNMDGVLPAQKRFPLGGPDGLRGHAIAQFHGDQLVLGQAEYTLGLWPLRSTLFDAGLHAIAFLDFGQAWDNPDGTWDVSHQRLDTDLGFGFSTSEDNLRVYFAKNLADPGSDFLVSMRLQRPF